MVGAWLDNRAAGCDEEALRLDHLNPAAYQAEQEPKVGWCPVDFPDGVFATVIESTKLLLHTRPAGVLIGGATLGILSGIHYKKLAVRAYCSGGLTNECGRSRHRYVTEPKPESASVNCTS